MPIHTHTHTYASHTRGVERERGRLHIRVTTISRTYRRQTFGKETDGENESSSRGWMGNADAAPSKEARTSALWIHTHTCTQWGSDSQPPFEISSSRILYILYTSSCHFPTHFSPPLEIRRNGWIQPGVVNFFLLLLLFLPSQPLGWIDRLFFSIRVCTSCVEECDLQKRNERESKVTQFGWPSSEQQVDSVMSVDMEESIYLNKQLVGYSWTLIFNRFINIIISWGGKRMISLNRGCKRESVVQNESSC